MAKDDNKQKLIEMNELSKLIKATDSRTALKWCENVKLPIMLIGKKKVTYRFLAEAELDKRMVQMLKKQYPNQWEELYQYYKSNDHYSYLIATQKEIPKTIKMESKIKPESKLAKLFADEND